VDHWRSEFLNFSTIKETQITRVTGEVKDDVCNPTLPFILNLFNHLKQMFEDAGVLITTYPMLSVSHGKSAHSKYMKRGKSFIIISTPSSLMLNFIEVMSRTWGMVIFDEVHHLPALSTGSMANELQVNMKLGLTGGICFSRFSLKYTANLRHQEHCIEKTISWNNCLIWLDHVCTASLPSKFNS
jgi:hypothetical protein